MQLTTRQKQAVTVTAVGLGTLLLAQAAFRRSTRYDFRGRAVLITGGSRGLGLLMARELVREGARVAILARDEAELSRAAADLEHGHPGAEVITIATDIRDQASAEDAVLTVIDRFGHLDVLINNAGVIQVGPLDHMKVADYEDALRTHFWGPLFMVFAAIPCMRREGAGRIVNISSIGGKIAVPHLLPYSASKFALAGFSEGLRTELARDNIVVTTVYPGLMRTGSPLNATFKGNREDEYAWFAISDSLPFSSIDAGRAARQVIDACRHGDAELVITMQAKLAILARHAAPELFADAMTLVNGFLPQAVGAEGDVARPGRESESDLAGPPSLLTKTTYDAAARNNEL